MNTSTGTHEESGGPIRPASWSDLPLALRADEVAAVLGVSRSTVHRLIAAGRLRAVRLSERRLLVSKDVLMKFMGASSKVRPTSPELTTAGFLGPPTIVDDRKFGERRQQS